MTIVRASDAQTIETLLVVVSKLQGQMVKSPRTTARFYRLFYDLAHEADRCSNAGRPMLRARQRCSSNPYCSSSRLHLQLPSRTPYQTTTSPRLPASKPLRAPPTCQTPSIRTYHSSKVLRQQQDADPQTPPLPDRMRTIMRRIPHSVAIVAPTSSTTRSSAKDSEDPAPPLAMTVSSFNTVCLQPTPIISFNTRMPSTTLRKIEDEKGIFNVFLLLSHGGAAAIAHEFAGGYGEQPMRFSMQKEREADAISLSIEIKRCLTPDFDGIVAILRCKQRVGSSVDVEDHRIVVADVLEVNEVEPAPDTRPPRPNAPRFGLVYAGGKYWRIDRKSKDPLLLDRPSNARKPQSDVEETTDNGSSHAS